MNVDVLKGFGFGLAILVVVMIWIRSNLIFIEDDIEYNRKQENAHIMNIYDEILPKLQVSIRGNIFKYVYVNEVLRVNKVYKDENGVIFRVVDIQELSEGKLIKYGVEIL